MVGLPQSHNAWYWPALEDDLPDLEKVEKVYFETHDHVKTEVKTTETQILSTQKQVREIRGPGLTGRA